MLNQPRLERRPSRLRLLGRRGTETGIASGVVAPTARVARGQRAGAALATPVPEGRKIESERAGFAPAMGRAFFPRISSGSHGSLRSWPPSLACLQDFATPPLGKGSNPRGPVLPRLRFWLGCQPQRGASPPLCPSLRRCLASPACPLTQRMHRSVSYGHAASRRKAPPGSQRPRRRSTARTTPRRAKRRPSSGRW